MKGQIWKVLVLNFFLCGIMSCVAQNQKLADSLIVELRKIGSNKKDTLRFYLLSKISFNHNNPDSSLYYSNLLASEATLAKDEKWSFIAYYNQGSALRLKGDLEGATKAYFKSLEYTNQGKDITSEGESYLAIGDVYSISRASENSILYYKKAILLFRTAKDSINLATALLNAGDEYLNSKLLDSALVYFNESGDIFEKTNYLIGKAYNLGNIGMVYANKGLISLAENYINEAVQILIEYEDYYPVSVYLLSMADIYLEKGNQTTALNYAKKSLALAQQYELKEQISDANLKLSELYELMGLTAESLKHYKDHVAYRDSVNNIKSVQSIADLRTDYEVSQKQVEVDLLNQQKKTQKIIVISSVTAMFLISLMAIGLYRRNKFIQKTKRIIEEEKNRSESLLLNILPEETAFELKDKGEVQAKKFDSVTVLFTDFKDFTISAEQVAPELLVDSIDYYFKAFDAITTKYGLEKIKTIGDAYMCAGGLPIASTDHAKKVVMAANEIAEFVKKELQVRSNHMHFEIRIGVNTGAVVAGIVGDKKWQYDIWGDTVNIASRMESNSEPGRINLSETTYQEIKEEFRCEYRGEIEVKNRGLLKMYFLS